MTEPAITTAAATASVIAVAGIATGLHSDLILPSFAGALWALRAVEQGAMLARVSQVAAGTLFSAWSTPAVSLMASALVPAVAGIDPSMLRFPVAYLIGWGGLRLLLPRVERLMRGEK